MTSIEWLEMEIVKLESKFAIPHAIYELCEQAKEMHKQEIVDAYYQCGKDNFEHIKVINRSATEYYNETFKKD